MRSVSLDAAEACCVHSHTLIHVLGSITHYCPQCQLTFSVRFANLMVEILLYLGNKLIEIMSCCGIRFFITTLLSYDSHGVKFTLLKVFNLVVFHIVTRICNHH